MCDQVRVVNRVASLRACVSDDKYCCFSEEEDKDDEASTISMPAVPECLHLKYDPIATRRTHTERKD